VARLAEIYDPFLFDLDGVVYVGPAPVDGVVERLSELRAAGRAVAFVTNNASRTPEAIAGHLDRLGVPADPADVVTSAQAAARLVAEQVSPGAKVLVVGGEGLNVALSEHGLVPVTTAALDPAAVVQGFHPDVGWRLLAEGAYALARGVPWVASNVDRTLPTAEGLAPGNGTLVEVLRIATGREPVVAGKPQRPLLDEAMVRLTGRSGSDDIGRTPAVPRSAPSADEPRPLVIGDRLDTDIEGANNAGMDSLLVLTGVTTLEDLLAAPPERRPTYVSSDLGGLFEPHPRPVAEDGGVRCGGWTAEVVDGTAHLTGNGNRDDGIRALADACWRAGGPVDAGVAVRALVGVAARQA